MSFNKNISSIAEQDEIIRVVRDGYVKGLVEGNFQTIMKTFHPEAIMYGFFNGDLLGGSINNLKGYCDQFGAGKDMKARIDVLSATSTSAVVRIELENAACGLDYTDFHSLMKLDGKWTVVSKTFHGYDK